MTFEPTPIVSRILADGTILEAVFNREQGTTALAIGNPDGTTLTAPHFDTPDGTRLVPYSASNNLLTTGCVLLPSDVGELGDKGEVVGAIREYLARYVDLSSAFMEIVPYYVMLTWVYDAFNELPYLRFRGDFGSGKTRALITIGSICYKPFFASGASTVSPIFHILDAFRGTLVLDEADFRFSDMTGELTKVLNNGTVNGLPVLRTMTNRHKELNPTAFRVFGPKILAMRESFADRALESRFVTEETGRRPLSPHIPIHTPEALGREAGELRNRLLAWRFANRQQVQPDPAAHIAGAHPRLNQMALALLSLVDDDAARARISAHLAQQAEHGRQEARETTEALVVTALAEAFAQSTAPTVRVADVAERFNRRTSEKFHVPMSNKAVGHIIRQKLGIPTAKFHGVYGIEQGERARVRKIAERFGVPHTLPMEGMFSPE
jgi:hypothetical protein